MKQFKVLSENFKRTDSRIKKICKRLESNNIKYTYKIVSDEVEKVDFYTLANEKEEVFIEVTTFIFEIEQFEISDYEIIAVIEHIKNNENLIHYITETENLHNRYRTIASNCEHCNTNRRRNKTVVLKSKQTGELIQVGNTCLKEYLNISNDNLLISLKDVLAVSQKYSDTLELSGDKVPMKEYITTRDYLANCICFINDIGYNKEDTKVEAFYLADTVDEKYYKLADDVIEFFNQNEFTNNFLHNTKVLLSQRYAKMSGFIAYSYLAYLKEIDKQEKKQEQINNSIHVGEVGDRRDFKLIAKSCFSYDSEWGTVRTYIFNDLEGNVFVWRTSKCISYELGLDELEGTMIELKGTIKSHSEYSEVKQTELTRCKILK